MNSVLEVLGAVVLVTILLTLIAFFPFAEIWALNHLFSLGLGYTFKNWLAIIILNIVFASPSQYTTSNE